jgi:hypothetical protein
LWFYTMLNHVKLNSRSFWSWIILAIGNSFFTTNWHSFLKYHLLDILFTFILPFLFLLYSNGVYLSSVAEGFVYRFPMDFVYMVSEHETEVNCFLSKCCYFQGAQ